MAIPATPTKLFMKITIKLAILCSAVLFCFADDQRTFFQVGDKIYSATNGWNLIRTEGLKPSTGEIEFTDDEGRITTQIVTPHTPMTFQLKNAQHEQITFIFSSTLSGHWTNRSYIVIGPTMEPSRFSYLANRKDRKERTQTTPERTTNFVIHETAWNETNSALTSAAIDFPCGKVRFNSDVP